MIFHIWRDKLDDKSPWEILDENGITRGTFHKLSGVRGFYNQSLTKGAHPDKAKRPDVIKRKITAAGVPRLPEWKLYWFEIKETANIRKTPAYRAFARMLKQSRFYPLPDKKDIEQEFCALGYTSGDFERVWKEYANI